MFFLRPGICVAESGSQTVGGKKGQISGLFEDIFKKTRDVVYETIGVATSNIPCPQEESNIPRCGLHPSLDTEQKHRDACNKYRALSETISEISKNISHSMKDHLAGKPQNETRNARLEQIHLLQELEYHYQAIEKIKSFEIVIGFEHRPEEIEKLLKKSLEALINNMTKLIERKDYCEAALLIEPLPTADRNNLHENKIELHPLYVDLYELRIKAFYAGEHYNETRDAARLFISYYDADYDKSEALSCGVDEMRFLVAQTYIDQMPEEEDNSFRENDVVAGERAYGQFMRLAKDIQANPHKSICSNTEYRDIDKIDEQFKLAYDFYFRRQLEISKFYLKMDDLSQKRKNRISTSMISRFREEASPIFKEIRGEDPTDHHYLIACKSASLRLAEIVDDFSDSKHIQEAIYYLIAVFQKIEHKQLEEGIEYFLKTYPDSEWAKKIRQSIETKKNIIPDEFECVRDKV